MNLSFRGAQQAGDTKSKSANYLWWFIFFLSLCIVLQYRFWTAPFSDPVHGIGQSSFFQQFILPILPQTVGLAWFTQLVETFLISFIVTLPLLLFSYKKQLGILAAIIAGILFAAETIYSFYLLAQPYGSEGGLLFLALPQALLVMAGIYFVTVILPLLIKHFVPLRALILRTVASVIVVFEAVAVIFLAIILIYTSYLATVVTPEAQAACTRMEQVTQYVQPWREYFRNHCQLGVGEKLPFPEITDQQFQTAIQSCDVQRYFLSSSGLGGICLNDRSAYITNQGNARYDQLREAYQAQSLADPAKRSKCEYLAIDFRFGDSEETYLKEMQKLCSPAK